MSIVRLSAVQDLNGNPHGGLLGFTKADPSSVAFTKTAAGTAEVEESRRNAYTLESDPLFFKWQAGEATEQEWADKRTEIRERFPK